MKNQAIQVTLIAAFTAIILFLLFGRYTIVNGGDAAAFKLDRLTGKTTILTPGAEFELPRRPVSAR